MVSAIEKLSTATSSATRDEVIPGLYIREIKSCVRGDHPSHISTRIGPHACTHAYVRACVQACCAAKSIRMRRNGRCFVSVAQITPDGERMAHGWKCLTCKLRVRMLDTSGSSCESQHNRSDDTVAPPICPRCARQCNNPCSGMRRWMALNVSMQYQVMLLSSRYNAQGNGSLRRVVQIIIIS